MVALLVVNLAGSTSPTTDSSARIAVPARTLDRLTAVSTADLATAARNYDLSDHDGSYPKAINATPLRADGKPSILYVGAEFCPYCATERWALVVALSRFGTFSGLHFIHSDDNPSEPYRQVPTISFYGSSYHSKYINFTAVETETVTGASLQRPTAAQQAILDKYDPSGSIPFIDLGGKATIVGAEYDPQLLIGKSWDEVVASIAGAKSALSASVMADAGVITSYISHLTGAKPAGVASAFPAVIAS